MVHQIILLLYHYCCLLVPQTVFCQETEKSLIHVSTCGHNPYSSNMRSILRWGTLSKVFEKYKNKQSVSSPLFNDFAKLFMACICISWVS